MPFPVLLNKNVASKPPQVFILISSNSINQNLKDKNQKEDFKQNKGCYPQNIRTKKRQVYTIITKIIYRIFKK